VNGEHCSSREVGRPTTLAPVHEAEARLRALVNQPRIRGRLRQPVARWMQLCAAMDLLGDAQLALEASIDGSLIANSTGAQYAVVYGLLQALYLQQDAANQIKKCLELAIPPPAELDVVRDTRNAAAGHPSTYKGGGAGIARFTLSGNAFELFIWSQNGQMSSREIALDVLCEQQSSAIHDFLRGVIGGLVERELEHRRKYRSDRLESLVFEGLGHPLEKLSAAAQGEQPALWEYGVEAVEGRIRSLRAALEDRGYALSEVDILSYDLVECEFALQRLREFFGGQRPEMQPRDAGVYVGYLEHRLGKIRTVCREIDDECATDTVVES
jgi:hypothetical protein